MPVHLLQLGILCKNGKMEPWWSGLTYLFAKEADPLKGLESSNLSGSAMSIILLR